MTAAIYVRVSTQYQKIDRFARSMRQFTDTVLILDQAGVRFIAPTQGIDTDKQSPAGRFLMQILATFAELERNMIVERVRAPRGRSKTPGQALRAPETHLPPRSGNCASNRCSCGRSRRNDEMR